MNTKPIPLEVQDEIGKLLNQASGIVWLMGHVNHGDIGMARNELENASWAVSDMLERVSDLVLLKCPEGALMASRIQAAREKA